MDIFNGSTDQTVGISASMGFNETFRLQVYMDDKLTMIEMNKEEMRKTMKFIRTMET